MSMAADQRRKRLNGASIVSYGSPEQHRTKRKNLGLVRNDLTMKSHVSVEWDHNQQRVVAKREQIGISWRQMKPFANFVPNGHNILADVFGIPQEIFGLDNLSEVLSYEVWMTHLSENERNLLMHFLPRGLDAHQVVQELLAGDNFQFGNPFLKWGASLSSGDLHPDIIINREQHLKSDKKAYYLQLHNYHDDMIGFLIKLKERWETSRDPEKEIVQKIWRSKNYVEKGMPSNVNEYRVYDHDGNVAATSESCSWDAEERAYSDNQVSSMGEGDKLQKGVLDRGFGEGKPKNLMVSSDDMLNVGARPRKGDKLHKLNIHSNDGDKYMSCIKISKKQHELVKSMKLSCKSIQSKSLNRVLGDLDNIHVQPYEIFIKEEQKKLHEHWLQLVNKDLPAAHAKWSERQIQRHAVRNSLVVELKDKPKPQLEDDNHVRSGSQLQDEEEDAGSQLQDEEEDGGSQLPDEEEDAGSQLQEEEQDAGSQLQDEEEDAGSQLQEEEQDAGSQLQDEEEDAGSQLQDEEEDAGSQLQDQEEDGGLNDQSISEDDEDSIAISPENQSLHNSYRGSNGEFNPMNMDSEKNFVSSKSDDASLNKTEYSRNVNAQDVPINDGVPFSSDGDVWQAVEMPHTYYDSAVTHEYTASGLSLANPQVNQEQRTCLINLGADLCQEETGKVLLQRQSDDGPFSSYQSQDRNDLLQSLFKGGDGVLSYHHEQKRAGLDFQSSNNVMMADGRFSSHFKEPLQTSLTLDQGQRRASEIFMPENMSGNIYSDGGRYLIPRQDTLSPVNMTDWSVNAARMAAPSQPHLNTGDLIGQQWFPADHQVRGGWNGSDGGSLSSQSLGPLGTGGNSDQSLFSILTQCNTLRSGSPYDSVRHTDPFPARRTYGGVDAGTPRNNAVVPTSSHPLDYFNGREAPSALVPDDMAWMSLHQNSGLHDQMGKPYMRSWNH